MSTWCCGRDIDVTRTSHARPEGVKDDAVWYCKVAGCTVKVNGGSGSGIGFGVSHD